MSYLQSDPPLFDVAAWRTRLAELQTDAPSTFRDALILSTEDHIAALETTMMQSAEKPPVAARSGGGWDLPHRKP